MYRTGGAHRDQDKTTNERQQPGDLSGEFEEDESRENGADCRACGAAHQPQHQLDVRDQDAHYQAGEQGEPSDQVEPGSFR